MRQKTLPIRLTFIVLGVKKPVKNPKEDILQTAFHLIKIINNAVEQFILPQMTISQYKFNFILGMKLIIKYH